MENRRFKIGDTVEVVSVEKHTCDFCAERFDTLQELDEHVWDSINCQEAYPLEYPRSGAGQIDNDLK
jgi:ribosomal protein L37AE/L43A